VRSPEVSGVPASLISFYSRRQLNGSVMVPGVGKEAQDVDVKHNVIHPRILTVCIFLCLPGRDFGPQDHRTSQKSPSSATHGAHHVPQGIRSAGTTLSAATTTKPKLSAS